MKRKLVTLLLAVILVILVFPIQAFAANDIISPSEFQNLHDGDSQYLAEPYRSNYHLDIKDLSIIEGFEKAANGIANALFGILYFLGNATVVIFYHCFSLDLAEMFGDQINDLLGGIKGVFFDSFFILAFVTSAFFICKQLFQRNAQGIINEILKVVILVVLSVAVTTHGSTFLTSVNGITKETAAKALGAVTGEGSSGMNNYAAGASGALWSSLVHKPWVALEFGLGHDADESEIKQILEKSKGSTERENYIKTLTDSKGLFDKDIGVWRIGYTLILIILVAIKCLFFIVIAFIQIAFQILTLFYLLLCPIILIMAVSPSLGGIDLVWKWLWKIFENMATVFVLTLAIGVIVKFDALIFDNTAGIVGWVTGVILQIFVAAVLVLYREKILKILVETTSKYARNPQRLLAQNTARSYYGEVESAGRAASRVAGKATSWIGGRVIDGAVIAGRTAYHASEKVIDAAGWVGDQATLVANDIRNTYESRYERQSSTEGSSTPSLEPPRSSQPDTKASPPPDNVINVDFKSPPKYESRREKIPMERPVSEQVAQAASPDPPTRPGTVTMINPQSLEYKPAREKVSANASTFTDPPISKTPVYMPAEQALASIRGHDNIPSNANIAKPNTNADISAVSQNNRLVTADRTHTPSAIHTRTNTGADISPVRVKAPSYAPSPQSVATAPSRPHTANPANHTKNTFKEGQRQTQSPVTPKEKIPEYFANDKQGNTVLERPQAVSSQTQEPVSRMTPVQAEESVKLKSSQPAVESFHLSSEKDPNPKPIKTFSLNEAARSAPDTVRSSSPAANTVQKRDYTTLPNSDAKTYSPRTDSSAQAARRPQKPVTSNRPINTDTRALNASQAPAKPNKGTQPSKRANAQAETTYRKKAQ